VIRTTLLFFLTGATVLNALLVGYTAHHFNSRLVYDIDLVRSQCLANMRYRFFQGCEEGAEYEQKTLEDGWNVSTTTYCAEETREMYEYMEQNVVEMGRVTQ
jgi:hypothetical protein